MDYLIRDSVVEVGNGFGYAYMQDPDRNVYHIVRVKIDAPNKVSVDSYIPGETLKELRDAKAHIARFVGDEMSAERAGRPY